MSHKKLKTKILSVESKFEGFLNIKSYKVEVEKHEGGSHVFERQVMERGHAVSILGYDPKADKVILINEFRAGILAAGEYPFTDTLPAGGLDGDTDISAAIREMMEETNLELLNPEVIFKPSYVSAGGTSEKISVVFGLVDSSKAGGVHGNTHEHEDVQTVILNSDEFIERCLSGDITDMKTVLAAYWLRDNKLRFLEL